MLFTCSLEDVTAAVEWAASPLPSHPTSVEFSGIHIEAGEDGVLTLMGRSADKTCSSVVPFEVVETLDGSEDVFDDEDEGEVGGVQRWYVAGRPLLSALKAARGNNASLDFSDSQMLLEVGTASFSIPLIEGFDASAGLDLPDVVATLSTSDFLEGVKNVAGCAADAADSAIPALAGVHMALSVEDATAYFVATDRYRLACNPSPMESVDGVGDGVEQGDDDSELENVVLSLTLMVKDAEQVARTLASASSEDVSVHYDANSSGVIGFSSGSLSCLMRIIDGDFPAWRQSLDSVSNADSFTVELDAEELADTVKRVSSVADDGKVVLDFQDDVLTVSTTPGMAVAATDVIELPEHSENHLVHLVNAKWLVGALSPIDRMASVSVHKTKGTLLISESGGSGYMYVAMTVNTHPVVDVAAA
jgi:DNA polymerase III sliding clamp (beta) subunit (PCNA family)